MKVLAAVIWGTIAIAGCDSSSTLEQPSSEETTGDRDRWVEAFANATDHHQIAELASHYLAVIAPPIANAWAVELDDDRYTPAGMLAQLADAQHELRDFAAAGASYRALLSQHVPYVSRGRLLYRLAFVTAGATLDDRILEQRGQVARVHAELLAIDAQVPASDEVREHLDYMIAVLGHMVRKPDRERTFALADKIGTEHDPLTRLSRLTLLDIAIDEAVESGQSTRATRLRTTRDAIAIKE